MSDIVSKILQKSLKRSKRTHSFMYIHTIATLPLCNKNVFLLPPGKQISRYDIFQEKKSPLTVSDCMFECMYVFMYNVCMYVHVYYECMNV